MTVKVLDSMVRRNWQKKFQKRLIKDSLFEQFSNRTEQSTPLSNGTKMTKIPDAIVVNVSADFDKGTQKTTVPMMDKLRGPWLGGNEVAEGEEETPSLRYAEVPYNVQRKSITLRDMSVDGDLTEAYDVASHGKDLLYDYFVELTDYNFQRSIIYKGDEFLTESRYWTGPSITSAPITKTLHPIIFVTDAATPVTWNNTFATYEASLESALAALTPSSVFDLSALQDLVFICKNRLIPLKWKSGDRSIKWVLKLTEYQVEQLLASGSGSFIERMQYAEKRGVENRAISNIAGEWRGALVVADSRAPIYDHSKASGSRFVFHTPMAEPTRTVHGSGAATGTCEVAIGYGRGAYGSAKVKPAAFNKRDWDYGFSNGMEMRRSEGTVRLEYTDATTGQPVCEGSLVYITATPSKPA